MCRPSRWSESHARKRQTQKSKKLVERTFTIPCFAGRRVLITGGSGFIGSNLAHRLVGGGATVSVLTKSDAKRQNLTGIEKDVHIIAGDIRNAELVERLVSTADDVFHLASQTSHLVSMQQPWLDAEINCGGTLNVLEGCRRSNRGANIVMTGTVTQVGPVTTLPVDESVTGRPIAIYDAHKATCEHYLAIYHRVFGLRTTMLRLSNVFGERQQIDDPRRGIVNMMIGRALRADPITVYGEGSFLRDYNYVQNVIDACLLAAASPLTKGTFYVEGSGIGTRFIDMMEKIVETVATLGRGRTSIQLVPFPAEHAVIDQGDFVVDAARLRETTGWMPLVSLKEGLRATVRFYQERL